MLATVLPLAAAANAALLAAALAYRARKKRARTGLYAAGFLAGAAAAIALITLDHAGASLEPRLSAFLEGALTLAAGPLLLLFITSLLGARAAASVGFAPLVVFVAAALVWPNWVAQPFVAERLVLVQMIYTLLAATVVVRHRPVGRRGATARLLAAAAVTAMAILHLAQAVRFLWPDVETMANVVPLAGAGAFLVLVGLVYFGGRISALDPLVEAAAPLDQRAMDLFARLDAALQSGLLSNPELTVAQMAATLESSPEQVSRAVLAARGLSVPEYLQRRRVEAAKRLLRDPAEARTSMDAIGLLVGFGSRSAFYKAFKDHVGSSPAAFRAEAASKPVQVSETGQ